MQRFRLHLALPVLLVTAGLAVSGCGGSSSDGGGNDKDAYVTTYEAACKEFSVQTKALQTEMAELPEAAGEDPDAGLVKFKRAMTEFLTMMGTQFQAMADAEAPEEFADFQKTVDEHASAIGTTVDDLVTAFEGMKEMGDIADFGESVNEAKFAGGEKFPSALLEAAPSCRELEARQQS